MTENSTDTSSDGTAAPDSRSEELPPQNWLERKKVNEVTERHEVVRLSTPTQPANFCGMPIEFRNLPSKPQEFEFECASIVDGVVVDPVLPENFDAYANEGRPARHLAWWRIPFVRVCQGSSPEFKAHWPEGQRYDVRCLDGGAWDRSTGWGSLPTLDEAVTLAKAGNPHLAGVGYISTSDQLKAFLDAQKNVTK